MPEIKMIESEHQLRQALDKDAKLIIHGKDGSLRSYKPTKMQLKAEYYRMTGESKRGAMRKAGYSMKHTATKMFSKQLSEYMNLALKESLVKRGINADKIADKLVEWLDAKETKVTKDGDIIENPDNLTQLKAYDRLDKVLHLSDDQGPTGMKGKRKMTIEEWSFGDEEETP